MLVLSPVQQRLTPATKNHRVTSHRQRAGVKPAPLRRQASSATQPFHGFQHSRCCWSCKDAPDVKHFHVAAFSRQVRLTEIKTGTSQATTQPGTSPSLPRQSPARGHRDQLWDSQEVLRDMLHGACTSAGPHVRLHSLLTHLYIRAQPTTFPGMGIPKAPGHCLLSTPAEGPEAARSKEQRQKVGFEVFPLSVPQVNPTSKEGWGKPSCPIAGLQHPQNQGHQLDVGRKTHRPQALPSPLGGLPPAPGARDPPTPPQHPAQTVPCPVCLQQPLSWQPAWPRQLPTRPARSCRSPRISPPSSLASLTARFHHWSPPPASGCCCKSLVPVPILTLAKHPLSHRSPGLGPGSPVFLQDGPSSFLGVSRGLSVSPTSSFSLLEYSLEASPKLSSPAY